MPLRVSQELRKSMLITGSLDSRLNLGFLMIYSGSQPATPEDAASGTLLVTISNAGGATGLTTEAHATEGQLQKTAAETWSGTAAATGVAGWFRWNELVTDLAGTQAAALAGGVDNECIDGAIAASGAQLNTSNTNIVSGAVQTISSFVLTLPVSKE